MRKVTSQITYKVPSWNFCNSDKLTIDAKVSKDTCRFCVKTKTGHTCLLYDKSLDVNDGLIHKVRECCKATAGYPSTIEEAPQGPTIEPIEIMEHTINLYTKTVNELLAQRFPRSMAEAAAKKHILGK